MIKDIYDFWFGDVDTLAERYQEQLKVWFHKNEDNDLKIKTQFEQYIEPIAQGEINWLDTPEGTLASIICLDQFPRNCYRGSPKSFQYDPKALAICQAGIQAGIDKSLSSYERLFFYLPLEHAENLALQNQMVQLARDLYAQVDDVSKPHFKGFLDYAIAHQVIIERFGRFPHRNDILQRESSAEEIEFLKQPNSSF